MSAAAMPSPELVHHLERAAEWRLLGQALSYPDTQWRRRMELVLDCIRDEHLLALGRAALDGSRPGLWLELFGPNGPVKARAVRWEGGLQPGALLAELRAFFGAFAYEPPEGSAPDELAVLLDFAGWLELKAGYALVRHDEEAAGVTLGALQTFLARFVAPVAWPVWRQLQAAAAPAFLSGAARRAAERAGPEPRPAARAGGELTESSSDEAFDCGGPEEFVPLGHLQEAARPAGPAPLTIPNARKPQP